MNALLGRAATCRSLFDDSLYPRACVLLHWINTWGSASGAERGLYPGTTPRYRCRIAAVDEDGDRGDWSAWLESPSPEFRPKDALAGIRTGPFVAFEVEVDRGEGWSSAVRAYGSRSGHGIIALAPSRGEAAELFGEAELSLGASLAGIA